LPSHGMAEAPGGRSQLMPCSLVPIDPLRHQAFVAEAFLWNGTPLDARELLRKGHLLRGRQPVHVRYRLKLGLSLDPGAERPAVLLNFPRKERLVAQGERARIGDLLGRRGQGVRFAVYLETPFLA
jgi:hypothetical protein